MIGNKETESPCSVIQVRFREFRNVQDIKLNERQEGLKIISKK